jgi:chemotaxis protein histidine kinase CheA
MSMSMSISMSKSIMRSKVANVLKVVEECGSKYNFDSSEALREISEILKPQKKEKLSSKCKYPLPFSGTKKEGCCNGIVKNHGLYTQCEKKVKESEYCKVCENKPYGSIEERLSKDLYEYKDPKGKGPKRYTDVLKNLKISKETIEKEAERLNIKINPVHFEEIVENVENVKRGRPKTEKKVKEVTGKKGRPKKEKKTVVVNNNEEDDLFATLIANANANVNSEEPTEVETEELSVEPTEVPIEEPKPKKQKKVKEVDPAKEAEKQKKAEEKAAKEAEKQKKAEEKAAKEAEKQKKAEEKAAKEAAKEAEKQKKAEEKAQSLPKEEKEADVVKKIDFEGKSYYKSKNTGVIYNMDQEVVGKWNEERNEIDFEEEEEEEEYDE